jgi:UDP-N-acetylglucosamine 4-epimerase
MHDDALSEATRRLRAHPARWLVTGSAGFIGSHLAQALLALDQHVVGIDNLSTGFRRNVDDVRDSVGPARAARYQFVEADVVDLDACRRACRSVDFVLHQAALGSVPRSIDDPLRTHAANASGFLNMLVASRDVGVRRFVYASSSSTYGDHPALPKREETVGAPLSPYAVTKYVDELYASVFARCYGLPVIGLRYFNVFGARQDPDGAYAAVIPRFVSAMLTGSPIVIHGDGETTRDFCYIENVVQANVLAATTDETNAHGEVFNIAVGARTSLNALYAMLRELIGSRHSELDIPPARHDAFRPGDVRHSEADIGKARRLLGYQPQWTVRDGLAAAVDWYEAHCERHSPQSHARVA